ncbi:Molybdenum cofactor sulfurase [Emericellopsis cladophorae]|uniref:Molybdenum cofactor sulfurase n=1 Tax=Emericellopsis cladophorae TaxID=2686198 RepID=A0A9Q0BCW4_9HYPO|nr:Molybdenum cofactor sulfurase [Emericellopsis cladophorae]KAI6780186.1 Molybdenum cofactor sulfurase [Emericellopsis cladophorae]
MEMNASCRQPDEYDEGIERMRKIEYPMLQDATYLDHAGTTLPPRSLMENFAQDMISNLYGNPHSVSGPSQRSADRIENARSQLLTFFKADPSDFDLVFVSNTTAGVKLVVEGMRSLPGGFNFAHHQACHTSLVGVREEARHARCFDDEDVAQLLQGNAPLFVDCADTPDTLVAFTAQSHFDGKRYPLTWARDLRDCPRANFGPIVSFNLRNIAGAWLSLAEFDKIATLKQMHVRTGGMCSPGGLASALSLQPWEMKHNFSAGLRCGTDSDLTGGKPSGVIRVSFGAMSTASDVNRFLAFLKEFFIENEPPNPTTRTSLRAPSRGLQVKSLSVFPIKSCAPFEIPPGVRWEVKREGLAWDREWCLVHRGSGQALSQKRYPQMALLKPELDFEQGALRVSWRGYPPLGSVEVPLSLNPDLFENSPRQILSRVCGESISTHYHKSQRINGFFSEALGVPCTLARFPAGGKGPGSRSSKARIQQYQQANSHQRLAGSFPEIPSPPDSDSEVQQHGKILLSNESPILMIQSASVAALNMEIKARGNAGVDEASFRANIVFGTSSQDDEEQPFAEDTWRSVRIGLQDFKLLGACRRCQMACSAPGPHYYPGKMTLFVHHGSDLFTYDRQATSAQVLLTGDDAHTRVEYDEATFVFLSRTRKAWKTCMVESVECAPDMLSLSDIDLADLNLHPATLQYSTRVGTESRFWSRDRTMLTTILIRQTWEPRRDRLDDLDEYDHRLESCRDQWAHPLVMPVILLQVQFMRCEEAVQENSLDVVALEQEVSSTLSTDGFEASDPKIRRRLGNGGDEVKAWGAMNMTNLMKRAHEVLRDTIKLLDTIRCMERAVKLLIISGDELAERMEGSTAPPPTRDLNMGGDQFGSYERDPSPLPFLRMAQEDNALNARMAVASSRDSASMKALAVITAIFLPGEFIGTLFGMSMFDWLAPSKDEEDGSSGGGKKAIGGGDESENILSRNFWVYWIISIPLTLFIILVWRLWWVTQDRYFRRHLSQELSEERFWTADGNPRELEHSFIHDIFWLSSRREESRSTRVRPQNESPPSMSVNGNHDKWGDALQRTQTRASTVRQRQLLQARQQIMQDRSFVV